jgi:hypothetical protein
MTATVTMGSNGVGTVSMMEPDKVNVVFHAKQILDPVATAQHGRPQFKSVDYVRIQHPGERDYTDDPVSDKPNIVMMFPRQWAAYQQAKVYVPEGTPVEMLFPQAEEAPIAGNLRAQGIHTVEQLANLNSAGMERVGMGAQHYVNHAKKYLETSSKGVEYHRLQKELAARDNKIEVLENNQRLLQSQLNQLMAERMGQDQKTLLSVQAQAPIAQQALPVQAQAPEAPAVFNPMPWLAPVNQQAPVAASQAPQPITETPATKTRGWPKGKPRGPKKPKTEQI